VGLAKAKELVFTGCRVDADEALTIGLVDRLSAPDSLVDDAVTWASELGRGARPALALGKSILNQSLELTAERIFALGSQAQGICYTTSEHQDSVRAFLAKAAAARKEKG
jgi:enoyl-CoA hydratase/carnithine racemase